MLKNMKISIFLILSTFFLLRVQGQEITLAPPSLTGIDGQNVSFTCNLLEGMTPNVEILRDDGSFAVVQDIMTSPVENNMITFTLVNLNATRDNGSMFRCIIVTAVSNVALLVVPTPVWYDFALNGSTVVLVEGTPQTINLGLTAFPDPDFGWFFDQDELEPGNGVTFTAGSITFMPLSREHSGAYSVAAENPAGSSSVNFVLDVQYAPVFALPGAELGLIMCGDSDGTTFYCAVGTNYNGANFQYFQDMEVGWDLTLSNYLTCQAEGNPAPVITGNTTAVNGAVLESNLFNIVSAASEAAGNYNCFAMNDVASIYRSYNLEVGAVPSPIDNLMFATSENNGVVTITVTFDFTDDSGVSIQYFILDVTDTNFAMNIPLPDGDETEVEFMFDIRMEDLDTGSYRASVVAVNLLGRSEAREMSLEIPCFSGAVSVASVSTLLTAVLLLLTALLLN